MGVSKKIRQQVFDKYQGRCAYCGCDLERGWHVDHFEPCRRIIKSERVKSDDGYYGYEWKKKLVGYDNEAANQIDNYMPSCASCNIQKHGQNLEDFRRQIAAFINSLNQYHSIYRFAKRYGLVEETNKPVIFYFESYKTETTSP